MSNRLDNSFNLFSFDSHKSSKCFSFILISSFNKIYLLLIFSTSDNSILMLSLCFFIILFLLNKNIIATINDIEYVENVERISMDIVHKE
ncbi:hypothetical protein BN179_1070002 [Clostridioides difficile T6]|nr:hypothetical protein BN179_1070002 [Clostridioides difficile T6]